MSARTTSPRTHVHVEYHVRKDVDLDELKREIARFVSGIHEHGIDHVYSSYQDVKDERHFVHVGDFGAETVPGLQTGPGLRARRSEGVPDRPQSSGVGPGGGGYRPERRGSPGRPR